MDKEEDKAKGILLGYKKKKRKERMPFAAMWMDLGIIISSKKDKYITYMWKLKK